MKTTYTESKNISLTVKNFGLLDARGREIGASVRCSDHLFIEVPEDTRTARDDTAPGIYYAFWTRATRDGQPYGASGRTHRFTTDAERSAAIAKYFTDAKKRAVKSSVASKTTETT